MDPNLLKTITLGPDARSNRGIFSRGKNVYRGVTNAPNQGMQAAMKRRLSRGKV